MKRYIIFFAMVLLISIFTVGCASAGTNNTAAASTAVPAATSAANATTGTAENGTLELTLTELAKYNGKDGQPAYVAVDGVIYDVSAYPKWKNGDHNGYSAGNDLTDIIKNKSPHGVAKLNGVPVVGKLIAG